MDDGDDDVGGANLLAAIPQVGLSALTGNQDEGNSVVQVEPVVVDLALDESAGESGLREANQNVPDEEQTPRRKRRRKCSSGCAN